MSKKLLVTISGTTNSGKSTILELIAKALLTQGINIVIGENEKSEASSFDDSTLGKRIEALVERDTILEIDTVQLRRDYLSE